MDSLSLDIFIACLSAFLNGNQRGVVWLCAGVNGWCSLACAMSRTSLAAPLASSGQSFLRSRSWGQGSLGRYTQADLLHLPGIMTLMPGGAWRGQRQWSMFCEEAVPSCWAQRWKLLGWGCETSQRTWCSCSWDASALCRSVGSLQVWETVTSSSF